MSALATVPEQEAQIIGGVEAATSMVERIADNLVIADETTAGQAEQLLQRIAREGKGHEAARIELVRPLNDHVRTINNRFKTATVPLDRARTTIGDKLLAYRAEQKRQREEAEAAARRAQEEEQRRLDDERRVVEAAARAEREAAAREAARKEAEAREAERKRREQMEREADALAQWAAGATEEALQSIRDSGREDARAAAERELTARAAARVAKEQAAAARQREEDARLAEQAAREAPRAVAAPTPLPVPAPAPSAVASRKTWKGEVIDASRVPRQYLVVDQKAINQAIHDGVRDIPGVDIRQHDSLAVRSAA